jgi:hypothetical protein
MHAVYFVYLQIPRELCERASCKLISKKGFSILGGGKFWTGYSGECIKNRPVLSQKVSKGLKKVLVSLIMH